MRKLLLLLLLTTVSITANAYKIQNQDTNFGSVAPEPSAKVQIDSTDKGFLPPRMTEVQRDAITVDADSAGLLIYNTDVNQYNLYSGSAWGLIGATGTLTPDAIQYTIPYAPAWSEGLCYYDDVNKAQVCYNDEAGVTQQLGQELYVRVKNISGITITNGQAVYISSNDSGLPTISLANANSAATATGTIGIATHDIETASIGYITTDGVVRGLNTSGFTAGDLLYISTTDGLITNTMPTSPNYAISIGAAGVIDAAVGTINVNVNIGSNWNDIPKFWNGTTLENTSVTVTESAGTVYANFEQSGTGDVNIFFNGQFNLIDCTPICSVALAAGSDSSPTQNWVYIPDSTKVLTSNTTGWPVGQHAPVATVFVQSAADVAVEGAYKTHAWTDHLSNGNDMGHIAHINFWIRNQHATWMTGMATTPTRTAQGAGLDNIDVAISAGTALQLHPHASPAHDTGVASVIHVVNDFAGSYNEITDLNEITTDTTGTSLLVNNRRWSVVLWQSVNETTGESKLFANAPSCYYSTDAGVRADSDSCSVYAIPSAFKGTGVLIARISLQYTTPSSGTLTLVETAVGSGVYWEDLRGQLPLTIAGGGTGGGGSVFADNAFELFSFLNDTNKMVWDLANVSGTKTWNIADISGKPIVENSVDDTATITNLVVTGTYTGSVGTKIENGTSKVEIATINSDIVATTAGNESFSVDATTNYFHVAEASNANGSYIGLSDNGSTSTDSAIYHNAGTLIQNLVSGQNITLVVSTTAAAVLIDDGTYSGKVPFGCAWVNDGASASATFDQATCPTGKIVAAGACEIAGTAAQHFTLQVPNGADKWYCQVNATTTTIEARAYCCYE